MAYDYTKYSDKRAKVLGVKKRGLSFGTMASIVSLVIVLILGSVVVPRAVAYFSTRNLDDAIYKMVDGGSWDSDVVASLAVLPGMDGVSVDNDNTRLVLTFNRMKLDIKRIETFFKQHKVSVDLLNSMGHRERMMILKKEAEFEAP